MPILIKTDLVFYLTKYILLPKSDLNLASEFHYAIAKLKHPADKLPFALCQVIPGNQENQKA